jgi:hypothetical protein
MVVSVQDDLTTDMTLKQCDVRSDVTNEADPVRPRKSVEVDTSTKR